MGEARRKKLAGIETIPPIEAAIDSYFRRLRPIDVAVSTRFWPALENRKDRKFAKGLFGSIGRRARAGKEWDDWPLLWSDLETAKATSLLVSPFARPWLKSLIGGAGQPNSVLDLGCGSGFLTCFYAEQFPETRVVGVDRSPEGIGAAKALAEELALTNVEFIEADVCAVDLGSRFDLITSTAIRSYFGWNVGVGPGFAVGVVPEARTELESRATGLVASVARHLEADGKYFTAERCPTGEHMWEWLLDLSAVGLGADLEQSTFLRFNAMDEHERIPMFVTRRADGPQALDVLEWAVRQGDSEDGAELRVRKLQSVELIDGFLAETQDRQGPGHVCVVVLCSEASYLVYRATSRGFREVMFETENLDDALACFDEVSDIFQQAPDVMTMRQADSSLLARLGISGAN